MAKGDVAKWPRRIENSFPGPTWVMGEVISKAEKSEQRSSNFRFNTFCDYLRLIDAFLGFYTETLELTKRRQERKKRAG